MILLNFDIFNTASAVSKPAVTYGGERQDER